MVLVKKTKTKQTDQNKEGINMDTTMNVMGNVTDNMFAAVAKGLCTFSPSGIAVKTSRGYRSYNVKTGKLTNCDNVVFHMADNTFFAVPATRVKPGDIIMNNGKPVCVRKASKDSIEVVNYETAAVETILPERHIFMGNVWFYQKITSLFGDGSSICGKGSVSRMMKFLAAQSIFGGGAGNGMFGGMNTDGMGAILPYLVLMKGGDGDLFGNMFDGLFDDGGMFGEEDADTEADKAEEG